MIRPVYEAVYAKDGQRRSVRIDRSYGRSYVYVGTQTAEDCWEDESYVDYSTNKRALTEADSIGKHLESKGFKCEYEQRFR